MPRKTICEQEDLKPMDNFTEPLKQLAEKGIYLIDKEICNETFREMYTDILLKKASDWDGEFTIILNSQGGTASTAWAFLDLMASLEQPIITIGTGEICSGAAMIFASGTKGKRKLTRNASVLIHEASGDIGEYTMTQHKAAMRGIDQEHNRHVRFWLEVSTLQTEAKVKKLFLNKEDNYFSPEDCLTLGIADIIL